MDLEKTHLNYLYYQKNIKKRNFIGIDIEKAQETNVESITGIKKPTNLEIKQENIISHLKNKQNYDHVFANFWASVVPRQIRETTFRLIYNSIRKNGRFILYDEGSHGRQLEMELQKAGFKVYRKPLTIDEIKNFDSETSQEIYHDVKIGLDNYYKAVQTYGETQAKKAFVDFMRKRIRQRQLNLEKNDNSKKTKKAINRIVTDVEQFYSGKPIVKIIATKR